MKKDLKILFFDIENLHRPEHIFNSGKPGRFSSRPAGFCGDLAYILVFGYKWLGDSKAQSIMATKKDFTGDPLTDSTILKQIHEVMSEADIIVSWYGEGHDFPFTTTRLAQAGMYLDQEIKHIDLMKVAKKAFSLSSNRLNNVAKFFNLELKTDIDKKVWADCWRGDYDALTEMAAYCRQDVEVLHQIYDKLVPLTNRLPHMGVHKGRCAEHSCSKCGSTKLEGNGRRVTKLHTYQRLRCLDCGGSTKGVRL